MTVQWYIKLFCCQKCHLICIYTQKCFDNFSERIQLKYTISLSPKLIIAILAPKTSSSVGNQNREIAFRIWFTWKFVFSWISSNFVTTEKNDLFSIPLYSDLKHIFAKHSKAFVEYKYQLNFYYSFLWLCNGKSGESWGSGRGRGGEHSCQVYDVLSECGVRGSDRIGL